MGRARKSGVTGFGRAAKADEETVMLHNLERLRCPTSVEKETLQKLLSVSRQCNPRGLIPFKEYLSIKEREYWEFCDKPST